MAPSSEHDPLAALADDFLARHRRGEQPAAQEYADRHPELAQQIRQLFATLLVVENLGGTVAPGPTGPARPHRLGEYRIIRQVGRGGMGVVYEAVQEPLGRHVALKVLSTQTIGDGKAQERFRREARAAAKLHHTNIVPVFDVGADGDVCYYAMQLIQGHGLDLVVDALRRRRSGPAGAPAGPTPATGPGAPVRRAAQSLLTGRFEPLQPTDSAPPSRPPGDAGPAGDLTADALPGAATDGTHAALSGPAGRTGAGAEHRHYFRSIALIGRQAAQALAHAHARGIVHRDIKPSNLLLDESGVVWVTDFGLAKTEEENLTRTGDLPGTLRYMAPERFEGCCDARADIYALGLTLYELLVLQPAFPATDRLQLLEQIRNHELARPRALDRQVPRDLETVVLKATDRDPRRRYATADDLAEDLRRFLAGEPIQARRTSLVERGWLWCRRNPVVAGLALVLLLLLVGGAVTATVAAVGFYRLAESASAAKDAADRSRGEAVARSDELRRQLSRQYVANGTRAIDEGDGGLGLLWYAKALDLDRDDPGRCALHRLRLDTTWRFMPRLVGVYRHDAPLTWTEMSPDATRVVTASYDGTARLWDLASGRQLARLEHPGYVFCARFSPDGSKVATACGDTKVRVWDGTTGTLLAGPWEHGYCAGRLAFSPDGKRLAVGCTNPANFWAPPPGVDPFDPNKINRGGLWDGQSRRPTTAIWDLERGTHVALECQSVTVLRLSFSADGKRVASCGRGREGEEQNVAFVCDADTGKVVAGPLVHRPTVRPDCIVVHVELSPDARRLITATYNGRVHLWDVEKQKLLAAGLPGVRAYFSRDGKLVFGQGIWGAAQGDVQTAPRVKGAVQAVAGGWEDCLALLRVEGGYRMYDMRQGKPRTPLLPARNPQHDALGAGGRFVLIADDDVARVWDLAGTAPSRLPLGGSAVAFDRSRDRHRTVTITSEVARVWDLATGRLVSAFGQGLPMDTVAMSPDGSRVATGTTDGTVRLWDADTGRLLGPPLAHEGPASLHFDATGTRLTTAVYGPGPYDPTAICAWDLVNRKLLWRSADRHWEGLRPSPDGRLLALTRDYMAQVLDAATGRALTPELKHAYWVESPDFTPDGKLMVTCDGEGTARIWDVAAGTLRQALRHPTQIVVARFSPDGKRLATGTRTGAVHLWDLAAARLVCAPLPLSTGDRVTALAFSTDGRFLSAGSRAGHARVWDTRTGEALSPTWGTASPPTTARLSIVPGSILAIEFLPGALGMLVQPFAMPTRLLAFAPDERPIDDWLLLAEVQANRRLSETGSATPLPARELNDAWRRLQRQAPASMTIGPDQVRSWQLLEGARLRLTHNPEEAVIASERLVATFPDDEQQWHYRGLALLATQRYAQAIDELAPLAGRMLSAGDQLVTAYQRSRRVPEGIRALGERLRTEPDNALLRRCRALLYAGERQWEPMLAEAMAGLAHGDPAYGSLHYLSGVAHAELGHWPAARTAFHAAVHERPGDTQWHSAYIYALLALGDSAALREEIGAHGIGWRHRHTKDMNAARTAAWMCTIHPNGDSGLGWPLIQRALASAPDSYTYLNTKAYVLYRRARYQEALDTAGAAVKAHAKGGTIYDWLILAMTHQQLKRPDEARREFAKVKQWFAQPASERRNDNNAPLTWTERLELDTLHAEARRMVLAR